jgi:probable rRNA maturation factor
LLTFRRKVAGTSEQSLARFVGRARRAAGLRGQVHVLVTSSRELRDFNRRFRRKNEPTDVLSFPSIAQGVAGDIAISAEIASANARIYGHKTVDELKILILHGVLHLAGYDHESDDGKMSRKEQRLRRELGLPLSLIERTRTVPLSSRASAKRESSDPYAPPSSLSNDGARRARQKIAPGASRGNKPQRPKSPRSRGKSHGRLPR